MRARPRLAVLLATFAGACEARNAERDAAVADVLRADSSDGSVALDDAHGDGNRLDAGAGGDDGGVDAARPGCGDRILSVDIEEFDTIGSSPSYQSGFIATEILAASGGGELIVGYHHYFRERVEPRGDEPPNVPAQRPLLIARSAEGEISRATELVDREDRLRGTLMDSRIMISAAPVFGGAYVAFTSPLGPSLARVTSNGEVLWTRTLRATADESLVAATPDGGAVLVSTLRGLGAAPPRSSGLLVAAFNDVGGLRWQQTIDSPTDEVAAALRSMPGGDILVLGSVVVTEPVDGPLGPTVRELGWFVRMDQHGRVELQGAIRVPTAVRTMLTQALVDSSGTAFVGATVWSEGGVFGFSSSVVTFDLDVTGRVRNGFGIVSSVFPGGARLETLSRARTGERIAMIWSYGNTWLDVFSPSGSWLTHEELALGVPFTATVVGDQLLIFAGGDPTYAHDRDAVLVPLDVRNATLTPVRCASSVSRTPTPPTRGGLDIGTAPTTATTAPSSFPLAVDLFEPAPPVLRQGSLCLDDRCR